MCAAMFRSQLTLSLRGIVVIAALMLSVGSAFAEADDPFYSANSMMPGCRQILSKTSTDPYHMGLCHGIIMALSYLSERSQFCAPLAYLMNNLFASLCSTSTGDQLGCTKTSLS